MNKKIIVLGYIWFSSLLFSNNLLFFKNYYPVKPFIHFLTKELVSVQIINDGKFGLIKDEYHFSSKEDHILIENPRGVELKVTLEKGRNYAAYYDKYGLRQTFELLYKDGLLEKFIWEHRFMIEGDEEPLMIREENIFQYKDGLLVSHGNDDRYSSRYYNYTDNKLSMIKNKISNGEKTWIVEDIITYTSEGDYTMEPCSELYFYSRHYPTMDKKVHKEVEDDGVTTITDTYYYNGEVYYKTVQKWADNKIIMLSTFKSIHNNTATFYYNYK